ncbi:hypothetical protein LINPERHAP1_LOCUS8158 [Linum perenne]
MAKRRR